MATHVNLSWGAYIKINKIFIILLKSSNWFLRVWKSKYLLLFKCVVAFSSECNLQTSVIKNLVETWYTDPFDQNFLFLYISDAPLKLFMNVDLKCYTLYLQVVKIYSIKQILLSSKKFLLQIVVHSGNIDWISSQNTC